MAVLGERGRVCEKRERPDVGRESLSRNACSAQPPPPQRDDDDDDGDARCVWNTCFGRRVFFRVTAKVVAVPMIIFQFLE